MGKELLELEFGIGEIWHCRNSYFQNKMDGIRSGTCLHVIYFWWAGHVRLVIGLWA